MISKTTLPCFNAKVSETDDSLPYVPSPYPICGPRKIPSSVSKEPKNPDMLHHLLRRHAVPDMPPSHQPLQPHPRGVHRTIRPRVNKHIIQERTKRTTTERSHHRDPKVVAPRRPHLMSIPQTVTHQPRPKVPRQVDRIARLPPETRPQPKNEEEQREREQLARTGLPHRARVRVVLERKDDKHEDAAGNELAEELARFREEGLRVGAEDARGGALGGGHGAHPGAVDGVDGRDVVGVDHAAGAERAQHLGEEVDGPAAPGELAEEAETERHGRVQESAAVASDIDPQHDPQPPAPTDALVGAEAVPARSGGLPRAEHHLRDGPAAEQDHDEGAKELGEGLAEHDSHRGPGQVVVHVVPVDDGRFGGETHVCAHFA